MCSISPPQDCNVLAEARTSNTKHQRLALQACTPTTQPPSSMAFVSSGGREKACIGKAAVMHFLALDVLLRKGMDVDEGGPQL